MKSNYKYKEYLANVFPCIYFGLICGSVTGAFIFLFKLAAKKAESASRAVYSLASGKPLYIAAVFVGLVAFAVAMYFLHKRVPEAKGGGIPRSEGVLRGVLSFRWFKTLVGTFFGSMISYLCGLPVGSEGPAVLMGTALGGMCGKISKNRTTWSRYVMTGGAGAGFAVATGAPFSGLLFALEEIHKRFTPMLVIMVSVSVVSASAVNELLCSVFGMSPSLFAFEPLAEFELKHSGYLILLGVIIALAVGVFDGSLWLFNRFSSKINKYLPGPSKLVLLFALTGILGFVFPDALYSGHDVIHHFAEHEGALGLLFALFAVRLLLMLFVTDSGATGGIFIPTLAIGALVGAVAAKLLVFMGMPEQSYAAIVLLGTCGFIGGTLRAPLTAAVLFVELTGQFQSLLFVALVIFTVNFITEIFNLTPFYDRALESMEHAQNKGRQPTIACFEMRVSHGAFVVGKTVRDIMWPSSSVVISVKRADESRIDMDHDGEKRLYAEDTLVVRAKYFDENEVRSLLAGLIGNKDIARIE